MSEMRNTITLIYLRRRAINRNYSRNAFARDIGISPTALSQFLSGKRSLSKVNTRKVALSLGLRVHDFLQDDNSSEKKAGERKIQADQFSLIAEWFHFAILNLVQVSTIESTKQMSELLDITEVEATQAVERLMGLGLLSREGKRYRRITGPLDTGTDIPSEALRRHNREKMELAIRSLEKTPLHRRDITSLTLGFHPADMGRVKKEVAKFKKRVQKIAAGSRGSEVYSLNVQFFPLSRITKEI